MMILPIEISALDTVTKWFIQGLENLEISGRVETIQITALVRSARILRRLLETCSLSNFNERPSANADVKNSHGVINIKIIRIISKQ